MAEPASSGVAGVAGWKLIGGLAGILAAGSALSWLVVVTMRRPKTDAEWLVSLITTLLASIAGGAWLLHSLGLSDLAQSGWVGLSVLLGLAFLCGLPAWALVRAVFAWLNKREQMDLAELAADAVQSGREIMGGPHGEGR